MASGKNESPRIVRLVGRPIPLRGNDIDTDQILPARFMKAVTFDGLGEHLFYDLRFDAEGRPKGHVLDDPRFRAKGPRIALVNKNFGCGSSREHAPQALLRWGIRALVGESFADIFFGNCIAIGVPCVTASEGAIQELMGAVEQSPDAAMAVDLEAMQVEFRGRVYPVHMPQSARQQLLDGTWNGARVLLAPEEQIRATAARLPYLRNFS